MEKQPAIQSALVQAFVVTAHGDLNRVVDMLEQEPMLVNAAWDWGGGDWETGLGGAAHMGRRDIALYLLDHGARMDIFAAAMLGYVEVVKAIIGAAPSTRSLYGPHGIPLLAHAQAGGKQAEAVVEYLQEL